MNHDRPATNGSGWIIILSSRHLIIVGAFTNDLITRLAGLAIAPIMLGAIFMVHWGRWNFTPAEGFPMGGMELQVVVLFTALFFLVMGNAGLSRTSSKEVSS